MIYSIPKTIHRVLLIVLGARKHTISLNQEIEFYIREFTTSEALTRIMLAKVEVIVEMEDSPDGEKSLIVLAVQGNGFPICGISGSLRSEDNTLHLESQISGLYAIFLITGGYIAYYGLANAVWFLNNWLGIALFGVAVVFIIFGVYLWRNLSPYRNAIISVFMDVSQEMEDCS